MTWRPVANHLVCLVLVPGSSCQSLSRAIMVSTENWCKLGDKCKNDSDKFLSNPISDEKTG
jgi:hypothetical protein